jgi:hypothetical protein
VSLVAFVWNEKSFASVLSFRFCRLELGTGKKKKQCKRRSQDIRFGWIKLKTKI